MSRSEYRKLFAAHGSTPLSQLHITNPQRVQTDYDSQCRSNVVVMSGDVTQSRIQIPKVDAKSRTAPPPLSTHSFLLLQVCLTNQDFACDVDMTTSFSSSLSNGPAQVKKVGLRISLGTYHGGPESDAKGGGKGVGYRSVAVGSRSETQLKGAPCRLPLLMHRGVWHTLAVDLEAVVCAHVETSDAFRDLISPPDVAKKSTGRPRHLNIVLTSLLLDTITISGNCRLKEICTASDEAATLTLIKESRLPRHIIPEHALRSFEAQLPSSPSRAVAPTTTQQPDTPSKTNAINVRFSKNAEGKVEFVAQDVGKEAHVAQVEELSKVQQAAWEEFRQHEEELKSIVAREQQENAYTRLVEPQSSEPTDRFGVRLQPKPSTGVQQERLDRTFNFDGWGRSEDDIKSPTSDELLPQMVRGRGGPAVSAPARGRGAAVIRATTPPPRGRGGRIQAAPPTRPIVAPAPSSLLLTSVMKRPLESVHPSDNLVLLGEDGAAHDAPSSTSLVLGHRRVGFGVGCLDVIHASQDDDSSDGSDSSSSSDV